MRTYKPSATTTANARPYPARKDGVEISLICPKKCPLPVQRQQKTLLLSQGTSQKKKCAPSPRKRQRADRKDRIKDSTFAWLALAAGAVITLLTAIL